VLPNENYNLTVQRAYFTYYTNDPEFEKEAKKLQDFNNVFMKKASTGKEVPELNKDPFELEEDEVVWLYSRLYSLHVKPQSINKEEKKVVTTLSKAENVYSITMEEPYELEPPESARAEGKSQSSDNKSIIKDNTQVKENESSVEE